MRIPASVMSVALLAGCLMPPILDDDPKIPPCGGSSGDSRVEISVPETNAPISQIVFVSSQDSFTIFCSYAWPSTQTVEWRGHEEQTETLLPDRIVEIRVYRDDSLVRIAAPFDLTAGRLVLLPDWPALVFNKNGVAVERSEVLPDGTGLDPYYDELRGLPFTGTHEKMSFEVNSTWNKGAQLALDVNAPHGNGFEITLILRSPSGNEALNVTVTDPDALRREIQIPETGEWHLFIDSKNTQPPKAGTFDVRLLFRY